MDFFSARILASFSLALARLRRPDAVFLALFADPPFRPMSARY
jgi:hypothetical protein